MLATLIALAAETAGEEPSQTLFYILGGAAAAYAVVVSAIGITQPDFPRSEGTAKLLYGLAALFVVGAMASAILTS